MDSLHLARESDSLPRKREDAFTWLHELRPLKGACVVYDGGCCCFFSIALWSFGDGTWCGALPYPEGPKRCYESAVGRFATPNAKGLGRALIPGALAPSCLVSHVSPEQFREQYLPVPSSFLSYTYSSMLNVPAADRNWELREFSPRARRRALWHHWGGALPA